MRIKYLNKNIQLPETFNHPDVIVEIPFEFGYVNYFPYYKEAETVVDIDKIPRLEKVIISNQYISDIASRVFNELNEENVYNFIFASRISAAKRALKYEFEDLYFKLISLAKEKTKLFGKIRPSENTYCETSLNEFSVKFEHPKFFLVLKQNENGELVTSVVLKKTSGSITRQDVQDFKQLFYDNLDKFTVIA